MTFREALMAADLDKVYALIHKRDSGNAAACDRPSLAQCQFNYSRVVKELLGKPRVKAHSMPILVQTTIDPFDKKPYIDVCLLNTRYVAPPKGAKPWGATRGKKVPEGHYNVNANKHNRCFSLMGIRWSKIIDTEIRIETKCTLEEAVSRLLWELTFDGWTEEKCVEKTAFIMDRIKEAETDIKKGNCITLPPKKKGGMKIVIPDAVSKQIMDIINKPCSKAINAKKCGTCWGNGLWPDGTAPMGPMDASDGMPTIPCPECGANPNPIKKK
jgi:hypothetical protein